MIQNLVIEPEKRGGDYTGYYFVTAGEGRRLAQLLRDKRKQIKKTEPIRWPRSREVGGYPFPCPPDLPADEGPALWSPELSASIVVLDAAPEGYEDARPIEPTALGEILADRALSDGRHLVIADEGGPHRLWIRDPSPGRPLAFMLPNGRLFDLRAALVRRLQRRLIGAVGEPQPTICAPSNFQRQRLVTLLALIDADQAGATRQDMASLIYRGWEPLSAIAWKASGARRHTIHLVHEAMALVEGGYRALLDLSNYQRHNTP